jgi:hypothetical protein
VELIASCTLPIPTSTLFNRSQWLPSAVDAAAVAVVSVIAVAVAASVVAVVVAVRTLKDAWCPTELLCLTLLL